MGPCDFRLIELIRQNRHLYDRRHPDFRNLEKKEITWRAIAAAQGSTAEICRTRFRSLRDRFVREKRQNKQQLLDGTASNPIWLKMMFLWDHLRPTRRKFTWNQPKHKRFENTRKEPLAIQNVYTVVPVDSSGVPIPNYPVGSASYILVNAAAETSPGLNNTVAEEQGPSEEAERVSPETPAQKSPEDDEVPSDVEEQKSPEAIADVPSDVEEQVSSKAVAEVPSDAEEQEPPEAVAIVPSSVVEQLSEAVAKVPPDVTELDREIFTKAFQSMSKSSKRGLQSRGKKRLKGSTPTGKSPKKAKSVKVRSSENLESSQSPPKAVEDSSCNAAFCTVVKNYLDKISNPMRLSSTRIKILSMVHDEMYSTN